jgi:hypothetical protein
MTLPDKTALAAEILRIVSAKDGEALRNFRCNANFRNPAILREWNSLINGCLTATGADDPGWSLLLLQLLVPEEDVSLVPWPWPENLAILAALAVVIALAVRYARRHPRILLGPGPFRREGVAGPP